MSGLFGRFIGGNPATQQIQFRNAMLSAGMEAIPIKFASILGRSYLAGRVFALPGVVTGAIIHAAQDAITSRERVAQGIASAMSGRGFTEHVAGAWAGKASVDKMLAYFETQLQNMKTFLPVDLYDSISSTPVAAIRAALRSKLEELGIQAGMVLTTVSKKHTVLTEAGRLVLQVWLDSWKMMVFDQVLEPSAFKVADDANKEPEKRRGREEQWAKMLMNSYLERQWLVDQRGVSVGTIVGLLQPMMARESARMQFTAYAWGAGFRIGVARRVGQWTYAKVTWAWPHAAGPREFLVRFRTDGDLLRDGFQVFATWDSAKQHFYSPIPLAEIDARLAGLADSPASRAVMDALNPWPFTNSGAVPLWFADLLDSPSDTPDEYPGQVP
jgi:hypothetical protein